VALRAPVDKAQACWPEGAASASPPFAANGCHE